MKLFQCAVRRQSERDGRLGFAGVIFRSVFAVGRAYNWAIHFFPRSEFVARVRIAAPSCLPSIDELGRLPVDRPVLFTNDFDVLALGGGSRVYFTSDR